MGANNTYATQKERVRDAFSAAKEKVAPAEAPLEDLLRRIDALDPRAREELTSLEGFLSSIEKDAREVAAMNPEDFKDEIQDKLVKMLRELRSIEQELDAIAQAVASPSADVGAEGESGVETKKQTCEARVADFFDALGIVRVGGKNVTVDGQKMTLAKLKTRLREGMMDDGLDSELDVKEGTLKKWIDAWTEKKVAAMPIEHAPAAPTQEPPTPEKEADTNPEPPAKPASPQESDRERRAREKKEKIDGIIDLVVAKETTPEDRQTAAQELIAMNDRLGLERLSMVVRFRKYKDIVGQQLIEDIVQASHKLSKQTFEEWAEKAKEKKSPAGQKKFIDRLADMALLDKTVDEDVAALAIHELWKLGGVKKLRAHTKDLAARLIAAHKREAGPKDKRRIAREKVVRWLENLEALTAFMDGGQVTLDDEPEDILRVAGAVQAIRKDLEGVADKYTTLIIASSGDTKQVSDGVLRINIESDTARDDVEKLAQALQGKGDELEDDDGADEKIMALTAAGKMENKMVDAEVEAQEVLEAYEGAREIIDDFGGTLSPENQITKIIITNEGGTHLAGKNAVVVNVAEDWWDVLEQVVTEAVRRQGEGTAQLPPEDVSAVRDAVNAEGADDFAYARPPDEEATGRFEIPRGDVFGEVDTRPSLDVGAFGDGFDASQEATDAEPVPEPRTEVGPAVERETSEERAADIAAEYGFYHVRVSSLDRDFATVRPGVDWDDTRIIIGSVSSDWEGDLRNALIVARDGAPQFAAATQRLRDAIDQSTIVTVMVSSEFTPVSVEQVRVGSTDSVYINVGATVADWPRQLTHAMDAYIREHAVDQREPVPQDPGLCKELILNRDLPEVRRIAAWNAFRVNSTRENMAELYVTVLGLQGLNPRQDVPSRIRLALPAAHEQKDRQYVEQATHDQLKQYAMGAVRAPVLSQAKRAVDRLANELSSLGAEFRAILRGLASGNFSPSEEAEMRVYIDDVLYGRDDSLPPIPPRYDPDRPPGERTPPDVPPRPVYVPPPRYDSSIPPYRAPLPRDDSSIVPQPGRKKFPTPTRKGKGAHVGDSPRMNLLPIRRKKKKKRSFIPKWLRNAGLALGIMGAGAGIYSQYDKRDPVERGARTTQGVGAGEAPPRPRTVEGEAGDPIRDPKVEARVKKLVGNILLAPIDRAESLDSLFVKVAEALPEGAVGKGEPKVVARQNASVRFDYEREWAIAETFGSLDLAKGHGPRLDTFKHDSPQILAALKTAMEKHGAPAELLPVFLGIIGVESTGDHNRQHSSGNATGLMGITRITAKDMGVDHGDMKDVGKNVDTGVGYYMRMRKLAKGRDDLALLMYTKGPGAVRRRIAKEGVPRAKYWKHITTKKLDQFGISAAHWYQQDVADARSFRPDADGKKRLRAMYAGEEGQALRDRHLKAAYPFRVLALGPTFQMIAEGYTPNIPDAPATASPVVEKPDAPPPAAETPPAAPEADEPGDSAEIETIVPDESLPSYDVEQATETLKRLLDENASSDEIAKAFDLYVDDDIEYSIVHQKVHEGGLPTYMLHRLVDGQGRLSVQPTGIESFRDPPKTRFRDEE